MAKGLVEPFTDESISTINLFVYGEWGTGKTRLVGSAVAVPEMCPVLYADFESGMTTLRANGWTRSNGFAIDRAPVRSFKDFNAIYECLANMTWLRVNVLEPDEPLVKNITKEQAKQKIEQLFCRLFGVESGKDLPVDPIPYRTVVLDSLTEIERLARTGAREEDLRSGKDLDPDMFTLRHYGKSMEQIRKMVRHFRDLPIHTLITALEHIEKDELLGQIWFRPNLPGKLAGEVPGYFDVVGRLVDEGGEKGRILYVSKTGRINYAAKDRTQALIPGVVNPDMAKIYRLIFGEAKSA